MAASNTCIVRTVFVAMFIFMLQPGLVVAPPKKAPSSSSVEVVEQCGVPSAAPKPADAGSRVDEVLDAMVTPADAFKAEVSPALTAASASSCEPFDSLDITGDSARRASDASRGGHGEGSLSERSDEVSPVLAPTSIKFSSAVDTDGSGEDVVVVASAVLGHVSPVGRRLSGRGGSACKSPYPDHAGMMELDPGVFASIKSVFSGRPPRAEHHFVKDPKVVFADGRIFMFVGTLSDHTRDIKRPDGQVAATLKDDFQVTCAIDPEMTPKPKGVGWKVLDGNTKNYGALVGDIFTFLCVKSYLLHPRCSITRTDNYGSYGNEGKRQTVGWPHYNIFYTGKLVELDLCKNVVGSPQFRALFHSFWNYVWSEACLALRKTCGASLFGGVVSEPRVEDVVALLGGLFDEVELQKAWERFKTYDLARGEGEQVLPAWDEVVSKIEPLAQARLVEFEASAAKK